MVWYDKSQYHKSDEGAVEEEEIKITCCCCVIKFKKEMLRRVTIRYFSS